MIIDHVKLERDVLARARLQLGNRTLKMSDIIEWGTHPIKEQRGQTVMRLTTMGINIRVSARHDNCGGRAT